MIALVLLASESETGGWLALAESGAGVFAVLLTGVALFVLLGGLGRLFAQLPLGRRTRARLIRALPVVEAVVVLLYLLVSVPIVFAEHDRVTQLVLAAVLLAAIGVSWSALRDVVHGTFIKVGELCQIGDRVAVDDKLGVVTRLGYRTLTLATDDGAEVFIPYTQLSRRSLVRIPRSVGVHRHGFEITLHDGDDPLATVERIKQLALSSHWSSVVREPEVDAIDGRTLRVQVFALGREHGTAVEALVRRELSG